MGPNALIRKILSEDEMKEMWKRIDDRKRLRNYISSILEEWDMKDPPNAWTGWPYEMIAEDILNKVLDKREKS